MKKTNLIYKLPLLLYVVLVFHSCSDPEQDFQEPLLEEVLNQRSIDYLALGDSYTVGESVSYGDSFPVQLTSQIEMDYDLKVNTTVIAQTGWRTDQLLAAVRGRESAKYNLVTLLIGVNNQFQSKPFSQYETEFSELLEKAIDFAGGDSNKVVVLSIPDYFYTPFGETNGNTEISSEIDLYNNYAKDVANAKGVTFLDITDITRKGLDQPELVAGDGLHPSGIAYEQFVERLYPLVRSRLKD
jgi:lysophospholipase L1-like esterase